MTAVRSAPHTLHMRGFVSLSLARVHALHSHSLGKSFAQRHLRHTSAWRALRAWQLEHAQSYTSPPAPPLLAPPLTAKPKPPPPPPPPAAATPSGLRWGGLRCCCGDASGSAHGACEGGRTGLCAPHAPQFPSPLFRSVQTTQFHSAPLSRKVGDTHTRSFAPPHTSHRVAPASLTKVQLKQAHPAGAGDAGAAGERGGA
jgi:hypothetical protein